MEQDALTDADLVAQTLAGNHQAFGELYDRYARVVNAVVVGISCDWAGVDDMVQECFLRAYRNLARLREPQRFGPWIVGIARHVARERRRSLRRDRHEFRGQQPVEIESPANIGSLADVEAELHDRDQLERVMRRLAGLPERERLAIHAFFLEQQDVRQAAEVVGLSRSGFYALVQSALARLAIQVKPCETKERTKR